MQHSLSFPLMWAREHLGLAGMPKRALSGGPLGLLKSEWLKSTFSRLQLPLTCVVL